MTKQLFNQESKGIRKTVFTFADSPDNLLMPLVSILMFLLGILLLGFTLFIFIPFVSAYTYDEQTTICNTFNYTFIECYDFWDFHSKYNSNYSLECENTTEYLYNCTNTTIYTQVNCTDPLLLLKEKNRNAEELARIDAGNLDCPTDLITQEACDVQISEKITEFSPSNNSNGDEENIPPVYLFGGAALIIVGIYFYRKKKTENHNNNSDSQVEKLTPNFPQQNTGGDTGSTFNNSNEFSSSKNPSLPVGVGVKEGNNENRREENKN